jgi:hypothetical protein
MPDSTLSPQDEINAEQLIGALGHPGNSDEALMSFIQNFARRLIAMPEAEMEAALREMSAALSLADPYRAAMASTTFAACIETGHCFDWVHRPLLTWLGATLNRCDLLHKTILSSLQEARPTREAFQQTFGTVEKQFPLDARAWRAMDTQYMAFTSLMASRPENRARVGEFKPILERIAPYNEGAFYITWPMHRIWAAVRA